MGMFEAEPSIDDDTNGVPVFIDAPREETVVQVKLTILGPWHRKAIGGAHTACGRPLGGYAVRDESYRGELCRDGCFSVFELAGGERNSNPDSQGYPR